VITQEIALMNTFSNTLGHPADAWHPAFLAMLPAIRRSVRAAFQSLRREHREEAVQEAIANACAAFARLVERGCPERAFPSVLARFAVAQVRAGRTVGTPMNTRDVSLRVAQQQQRFIVERLERYQDQHGRWQEAVLEDTRTDVAEQACFRVDFPDWLSRLLPRDRRIAEALALGHPTSDVARHFALSPGRVAQLRRELHDSWQQFHGEVVKSAQLARTG
jgi:hypothetical protein